MTLSMIASAWASIRRLPFGQPRMRGIRPVTSLCAV